MQKESCGYKSAKEGQVDHEDVLQAVGSKDAEDHGALRGAGDGHGHESSGQISLLGRLQYSHREDRRHAASHSQHARKDGSSMQADPVHECIQDDAKAGQVADILQDAQHQVEGNQERQDHTERNVEACGEDAEGLEKLGRGTDQNIS